MPRITRNPNERPEIPPGMLKTAKENNWHIVAICCDPPNTKVGDWDGVAFWTMSPNVPQIGSCIQLEDGKICKVDDVTYRLSRHDGHLLLVPNVYALLYKVPPKTGP